MVFVLPPALQAVSLWVLALLLCVIAFVVTTERNPAVRTRRFFRPRPQVEPDAVELLSLAGFFISCGLLVFVWS